MATRVFADQEPEALRRFPEIGREELFRSFTLAPADVAFIAPGRGRGPTDRLGLAVTSCTLPWLGFVPDDVASAPPATALEVKELDEFLPAREMGHDSPTPLFRLAWEYLISAKAIRPGPVTLVERIAHARQIARAETFDRLAHELNAEDYKARYAVEYGQPSQKEPDCGHEIRHARGPLRGHSS
ncbi:DUF4158 domain-containing protein [Streptosporangium sp. NPDC001559]|uniref:DUF4158 domain-containing protein n=1 Tax=Streptosporangium sp. NPDC001559 TaxID=3366187 RepID=UPI0036E00E26